MLSWDQAKQAVEGWQKQGYKVVFTNGCFDLLHVGHVRYLQQARAYGDVLLLGLNSDASVKRLKGNQRPIVPQEERAELLEALSCIDGVVFFEEDTPLELIVSVQPDVLTKGGDYTIENIVGAEEVMACGGEVEILSFVDGKSSTNVVEKIRQLEMSEPLSVSPDVLRIIDANVNRLREGVRVVEEYARFVTREESLVQFCKDVRHRVSAWLSQSDWIECLIEVRDVAHDCLRDQMSTSEGERANEQAVLGANLQRVKETLRVLEEYGKVISVDWGVFFQKIRFEWYELEKGIQI